jgi:hypothetical protein
LAVFAAGFNLTPRMPAVLRSNSGRDELRFDLRASQEYATDAGFEACVSISGEHWDGDHTFPVATSAEGIWLRCADLLAMREHIVRWTGQSLEQLDPAKLTRVFELARLPGQRVSIRFGPRPDIVPSPNPTVSVTLSAGSLNVDYHFVTDQSCLRMFAEELLAETSRS